MDIPPRAPRGRSRAGAEGSVSSLPASRQALLSQMQAGAAVPACWARPKSGRIPKPQKNAFSYNNLCNKPSNDRQGSEMRAEQARRERGRKLTSLFEGRVRRQASEAYFLPTSGAAQRSRERGLWPSEQAQGGVGGKESPPRRERRRARGRFSRGATPTRASGCKNASGLKPTEVRV